MKAKSLCVFEKLASDRNGLCCAGYQPPASELHPVLYLQLCKAGGRTLQTSFSKIFLSWGY